MEIFKLFGSIMVDTAKAEESLHKTDEKANNVGETFLKGAKKAGQFAVGIATMATGAVAGLGKIVSKTAETADNIDKMSQRLGLSTDSFQELDFVLSQSGVDINSFQTGMKTLVKNMDAVSEGNKTAISNFEKLGISVTEADGTLRNEEDVLFEAISAFQAMEDSTEKTRLAQELFGKQGQEIIPLLNSEAGSLEAMRQEAHDLGLVMSEDAVKGGADFTDAMDKLKRSVSMLGKGIGSEMMPLITDFINEIIAFMPTIIQIVQDIAPTLNQLLSTMLPIIMDVVRQVLPPLLQLVQALLPLFTTICELILPVLIKLITTVATFLADKVIPTITKVVDLVKDIIKNAPTQFNKFKQTIVDTFNAIKEGVKKPINAVIGMINKMIDAVNALSFDIPDWVPVLGGKSFGFNLKNIPELANGGSIVGEGSAIVGEAGAELINMPKGATVTPLTRGETALNADKILEVLQTMQTQNLAFMQSFEESVASALNNVGIKWDDRELGRMVQRYA